MENSLIICFPNFRNFGFLAAIINLDFNLHVSTFCFKHSIRKMNLDFYRLSIDSHFLRHKWRNAALVKKAVLSS